MLPAPVDTSSISIRIATTPEEVEEAQRLRYRVFYEEYAATPNREMAASRLDKDDYDAFSDHLIVVDSPQGGKEKIVGTYRLLRQENAKKHGSFYTSSEFDIGPLERSGLSLLELGRSCVMPEYRTKRVMQILWEGIADYITENNVGIMFGCASLHGTDIKKISTPLSYLHHFHPCPENLRPRAVKGRYIGMNIVPKDDLNPRRAFAGLPPLIKGYLRLGATIGDGAVIDEQFSTTDVCIVVQTHLVTSRYRKHYERKIHKSFPGGDNVEEFPASRRPPE